MPDKDSFDTVSRFTYGVNLRGFTGSATMRAGEASDAMDMLPRPDGATYRTFGWRRVNDSALAGRPLAIRGFSYRGKNNDAAGGNTARTGNFALADDGAVFTRRTDEFSTCIVLTTTTFYFWNPSTLAFETVALPGGVSVDPDPIPTILVAHENAYIVGWADSNLRYDPTDRALYLWGWESSPAAPGATAAAGGTLQEGATYRYGYTYFDVYTGEETALDSDGSIAEVTTTTANRTVDLTFVAYAGSRHFNDLAIATDSDVGIAVYRSPANDPGTFYLLTTLNPGTLAYSDTGDALDTSLPPFEGTMQDEPRFSMAEEFRGRFYAISRKTESNRLYYSDINQGFFFERWKVRSFKDLPVVEGDALTAIGKTDATIIVHTRKGGFRISAVETGRNPQHIVTKLPWEAGATGPRARLTRNGWEYWLSERGPYRWREGILKPQWIGKNIEPLFLDPTSGLCRLSEAARDVAQLAFDWLSNTIRFFFAIGPTLFPNEHWAYWVDAEKGPMEGGNGDPETGWFPQSPQAQCADLSQALDKLDENGRPVSGEDRLERFVFADDLGYVYEYDISHRRGGLREGMLAKGFVRAGSTSSTLNVDGGLFTGGDGLTGLRLEVLDEAGTVQEARTIESNTDNTIVVTEDFERTWVDGDRFYVGGIPAYWKSWYDHFGDPHVHKRLLHLYVGFVRGGPDSTSEPDWKMDISVAGGEFPTNFDRTRSAKIDRYHRRVLVSLVNRYFLYEFRNFRPDEIMVITSLQRSFQPILARRRA